MSSAELADIAHEQTAEPVRQEHPLVRIERDRIGAFDPHEARATALGQLEEPSVRGVDVQPQPMPFRDIGDVVQRVDRAGVRRAGAGDDHEGA
jgi:hypothetical protein